MKSRYISILRGINVGGKRKILMADLKALYEKMSFENPITYIQSGNVAFEAEHTLTVKQIEDRIAKGIEEQYGFDVPVLVRTAEEMREIIDNNPYLGKVEDSKQLHVTFLSEAPSIEQLTAVRAYSFSPDEFEIVGKEVYLNVLGKYHQTKLSNAFF